MSKEKYECPCCGNKTLEEENFYCICSYVDGKMILANIDT